MSNVPGPCVGRVAAAAVDERNPHLVRERNEAGQLQRHTPQGSGQLASQPGAVVDRAAAAAVDERNPRLVREHDEAGRPQRHPPQVRGQGRKGKCYEVRRVADGPDAPWQWHASGVSASTAMGYQSKMKRAELLGSAPVNKAWQVRAV